MRNALWFNFGSLSQVNASENDMIYVSLITESKWILGIFDIFSLKHFLNETEHLT